MKTEVKTLQINDETEAVILVPELSGELAIVYLETLQRITRRLNSVPFGTLKQDLINSISPCSNLEELVDVMEDEIKFHKSVNMINEYKHPTS